MNDFSPWLVAIFTSKLLLYIAYAMSIGGVAAVLMIQNYKPESRPFLGYALCGSLLGLITASINFLLQVGMFSDSGVAGMWDPLYRDILWQSGIGMSYKLRLAGGLGLLALLAVMYLNSLHTRRLSVMALVVSLLIAASFTWVGHTAEQAVWVRIAIVLHIFIAMWWVGLLYPLRHWCTKFPCNAVQQLMHEFGQQASVLVVVLLAAGVGISYILEGSVSALLTSSHGNLLLLKLVFVASILGIAAYHKLRLVPSLTSSQSALKLKSSISKEMIIALLILITTAALSTLVGPNQM